MAESSTSKPPLAYDITRHGSILEIHLSGYLDGDNSLALQRDIETQIESLRKTWKISAVGLLYIDELEGFERAKVAKTHGEWFKKMQPQLFKVAVVSPKTAITWAIAIAKLMTKVPLERFAEKEAAMKWLAVAPTKKPTKTAPEPPHAE
jgi:hypothetical protein